MSVWLPPGCVLFDILLAVLWEITRRVFANSGLKCESKQIKNSRIAEKKNKFCLFWALRDSLLCWWVLSGVGLSTLRLFNYLRKFNFICAFKQTTRPGADGRAKFNHCHICRRASLSPLLLFVCCSLDLVLQFDYSRRFICMTSNYWMVYQRIDILSVVHFIFIN